MMTAKYKVSQLIFCCSRVSLLIVVSRTDTREITGLMARCPSSSAWYVAGVAVHQLGRPAGLVKLFTRKGEPKGNAHNLFCFLRCVVFDDDKPRRLLQAVLDNK